MKKELFKLMMSGFLLLANIGFSQVGIGTTTPDPYAKQPKRVGMVTGLNPEKADYYRKLHADTWEGVLNAIRKYNIRNYSIYLKEIEGKLYLFSYYEYIGDDYESDMKRIAADTTTMRWWRETDPCQLPLSEAKGKNKIWTIMKEVFHAD